MKPFTTLTAKAAPLDVDNIDTDQIIPKQFLKTTERVGLAKGLFYDLRFDAEGQPKAGFVLDDPLFAGAGVLIAGDNFGCGSSREHAPWALMDFGVRCIISTSFADIFRSNSLQNGLLLITLPKAATKELMAEAKGGNHVFTVDLEGQVVTAPSGKTYAFEMDRGAKTKLIKGLDSIGETLGHASEIDSFEARRGLDQPWLATA
jgi:3-isopropylmalate dehydratase small subunit